MTQGGQWVHLEKPPCRCATKPTQREISPLTHGSGSIWMCACGKQWKMTWIDGGQRDGTYPDWTEVRTPPPTDPL